MVEVEMVDGDRYDYFFNEIDKKKIREDKK